MELSDILIEEILQLLIALVHSTRPEYRILHIKLSVQD